MAVYIDLRKGLPKARRSMKKVLAAQVTKECCYTAPCVIGAMVPPAARLRMEYPEVGHDSTMVGELLNIGVVEAPPEQVADIRRLQAAFDDGDQADFLRIFEKMEAKYAASGIEL